MALADKLADRYAPLALGHIGEPPLQVLNSTPGSGVEFTTTPLARFEHPSTELAHWAASQHSPFSVSADLVNALETPELGGGGDLEKAPIGDPSSYTVEQPLPVPFIEEDQLYMVSVGHWTVGWRDFADWGVSFQRLEGDQLGKQTSFAVGMWKGDLESVRTIAQ